MADYRQPDRLCLRLGGHPHRGRRALLAVTAVLNGGDLEIAYNAAGDLAGERHLDRGDEL